MSIRDHPGHGCAHATFYGCQCYIALCLKYIHEELGGLGAALLPLINWRQREKGVVTMDKIRLRLNGALYCINMQRRSASNWFPEPFFGTPGRRALSITRRMILRELRAAIR